MGPIADVLMRPLVQFQRARAYIAWRAKRWEIVASAYEFLNLRGLADTVDRAGLATAYVHLRKWQEAIEIFDGLELEKAKPRFVVATWFNHALALYEMGRYQECADLLERNANRTLMKRQTRKEKEEVTNLRIKALITPLGMFESSKPADWQRIADTLIDLRNQGVDSYLLVAGIRTGACSSPSR